MYTENQYCSECCSGEESTVFPSNSDYNTSNNPNGQAGYTGTSMTAAQKQALLNELMNLLNQLDPVSSDCLGEKLYYVAHLDKALVQYTMVKKARDYSNIYFCSPGQDNDNKNAYRHMMWNALMAKAWGEEEANFLSNLHECDADEHPLNHNMDMWNNVVGADYGANYEYSSNSLALEISQVVKDGLGRRIENSYLIPTNAESACTNN